jgi:hypothetical protein
MRSNNHNRRLDRLQDKLHIASADEGGESHFLFWIVGLPTFEAAVERAKNCGGRNVTWVPLKGEIQFSQWEHVGRHTPANVFAFEGPFATRDQLQRLIKDADPSYVVEDDYTKLGGYSWADGCGGHPPPERPPPKGKEEFVEFMRGVTCTMRLFVAPEELPC